HHPALREVVPLDDRITIIVPFAAAAKARPYTVAGRRAVEAGSRGFVEHGEGFVDPLHVLCGTHGTVSVWRCGIGDEAVVAIAPPGKAQTSSGDSGAREAGESLHGIVYNVAWCAQKRD